MALTQSQVLMHCADVFLAGSPPNHHSADLASFVHNVRSVLMESGQAKLGGVEFSIINVAVEEVLTAFNQEVERIDATTAHAMGQTLELQIVGDIIVKNVSTGSLVLIRKTPLMCVPNINTTTDPNTFVVNGTLRTIISNCANRRYNFPHLFTIDETDPKRRREIQYRSQNTTRMRSSSTFLLFFRSGRVYFTMTHIKPEIHVPYRVILGAFGVEQHEDAINLLEHAGISRWKCHELLGAELSMSEEEFFQTIARKMNVDPNDPEACFRLKSNLASELIPHTVESIYPQPFNYDIYDAKEVREKKVWVLVDALCALLSKSRSKDFMGSQTVSSSGHSLLLLIRQAVSYSLRRATTEKNINTRYAQAHDVSVSLMFRSAEALCKFALATGTFAVKKQGNNDASASNKGRTEPRQGGYFYDLDQNSSIRCGTSTEGSIEQRMFNASKILFICPVESPDGPNCGMRCAAAMTMMVRPVMSFAVLERLLKKLLKNQLDTMGDTEIVFEGRSLGMVHGDGDAAMDILHTARQRGMLDRYITLCRGNRNEIQICASRGATVAPLMKVDRMTDAAYMIDQNRRGHTNIGTCFSEMIRKGIIEYHCPLSRAYHAENNRLTAATVKDLEEIDMRPEGSSFVYIHICNQASFSPVAAVSMLFGNNNPGTRQTYDAMMTKSCSQNYTPALGSTVPFPDKRYWHAQTSKSGLVQYYPQRPLVTNTIGDDFMRTANTQHAFVVVKNEANSIEDAVVVNKDFVDRGGGRSMELHRFQDKDDPREDTTTFEIPVPSIRVHPGKYGTDTDGLPKEGEIVKKDDVVIAKKREKNIVGTSRRKHTQASDVSMRNDVKGTSRVMSSSMCTTPSGRKVVEVLTTKTVSLVQGNKGAFPPGQKFTVGSVASSLDLPFNRDGMTGNN